MESFEKKILSANKIKLKSSDQNNGSQNNVLFYFPSLEIDASS